MSLDNYLAGHDFIVFEVLKMGEVGDVISPATLSLNAEGACKEPGATRAVDQPIGMIGKPGEGERFGGELQIAGGVLGFYKDGAPVHEGRAELDSAVTQEIVEARARDVVSVAGIFPPALAETEMKPRSAAVEEGGSGFPHGKICHALLDAELAQHRNDGRYQRFANEESGTLVVIEDDGVDAAQREQTGQRGTGGAGSDDRNRG